jgi:hypothetical protein
MSGRYVATFNDSSQWISVPCSVVALHPVLYFILFYFYLIFMCLCFYLYFYFTLTPYLFYFIVLWFIPSFLHVSSLFPFDIFPFNIYIFILFYYLTSPMNLFYIILLLALFFYSCPCFLTLFRSLPLTISSLGISVTS